MDHDKYNSREGFQTKIWGPSMWFSLHVIAANYWHDRKDWYVDYFVALEKVLPCGSCRSNYPNNVRSAGWPEYPDVRTTSVFDDRESMERFVFDLHNVVNTQTGKSIFSKTFEETRDFYEQFRAQGCTKPAHAVESGCIKPLDGVKPGKCVIKVIAREDEAPAHSIVCSGLKPVTLKGGANLGIHVKPTKHGVMVTQLDDDGVPGVGVGWILSAIDGVAATWDNVKTALTRRSDGGDASFTFVPPCMS